MHNRTYPLVLWDVDGTLVRGNGSLIEYVLQALRDVYGIAEPARIAYGGKTDQQIVVETLALHAINEKRALAAFKQFSVRYGELVEGGASDLPQALRVLPGVPAVLQRLDRMRVPQSLLTGNIASVAAHKLRAVELAHFFDLEIGAYGSDHRDRNQLVSIARRKAQARYGQPIERVVVIGDTPHDIACARAGAARAVAVATGSVSLDDLARHQPDSLLPDLGDTDVAVAAILANEQVSMSNEQKRG
jgi:phosphoglycolate phosphatase-like HAD superfamily hydrolase